MHIGAAMVQGDGDVIPRQLISKSMVSLILSGPVVPTCGVCIGTSGGLRPAPPGITVATQPKLRSPKPCANSVAVDGTAGGDVRTTGGNRAVLRFIGRCRKLPNGRSALVGIVRMSDGSHDGEEVEVSIDGSPSSVSISRRNARVRQLGAHGVDLLGTLTRAGALRHVYNMVE